MKNMGNVRRKKSMMTITRHPAHLVAKEKRQSKQVCLILKVDGFVKENIRMYLPMQYKTNVIRMAGLLVIVFIQGRSLRDGCISPLRFGI